MHPYPGRVSALIPVTGQTVPARSEPSFPTAVLAGSLIRAHTLWRKPGTNPGTPGHCAL